MPYSTDYGVWKYAAFCCWPLLRCWSPDASPSPAVGLLLQLKLNWTTRETPQSPDNTFWILAVSPDQGLPVRDYVICRAYGIHQVITLARPQRWRLQDVGRTRNSWDYIAVYNGARNGLTIDSVIKLCEHKNNCQAWTILRSPSHNWISSSAGTDMFLCHDCSQSSLLVSLSLSIICFRLSCVPVFLFS